MSDDRAAIAILDGKLGYTFDLIDCKPKNKGSDEVNAILEKSNSIQKNAVSTLAPAQATIGMK